ncbi:MAG TPA: DUF4402 domain-containing protein [Novosphingobium sp.]|nr:DUF4402 domain-containing protein [Novosphingobium sp.]
MTGVNPALSRFAGRPWRALLAFAIALAWLAVPDPASAQTRARVTRSAPAKAVVLSPLSLVKTADMSFAKIAARPVAGTVTVDSTTGACSYVVVSGIGTCSAAKFSGRGAIGGNVRISLVNNTNLTGPGQTMVLDTIKVSGLAGAIYTGNTNANGQGVGLTQGNGNQRYRIGGAAGVFDFAIGGTLHVNANQLPGIYRGTVTVTVSYN